MALIACPECKQQISDAAISCPHCGYPMQPEAASVEATPAEAAELVSEFSTQINDALRKARLSGLHIDASSIGKPSIATRVFTSSRATQTFITPSPNSSVNRVTTTVNTAWTGTAYSYRSKANLFGLPLLR